MAQPLFRRVRRRNPFAVTALPWLGRLYRAAYRKRRRVAKRFIGKPAQKLFGLAHGALGAQGQGRFTFDTERGARELTFDVRNTQFGALFLPQYKNEYEAETTALFDIVIGDEDVFFDVGSNWGYYAFFITSRPGFAGGIHAFEPLPASYANLADLVRQAGLSERIKCHNVALSDRHGTAAMTIEDGLHSGLARLRGATVGPEVTLVPLDDLDVPAPHAIKIDVEGHEGAMLSGARRILAKDKPWVVFESWNEPEHNDITFAPFQVLEELDYVFFQPAWAEEVDGHHYATGVSPMLGNEGTLALIPFGAEQRLLLQSQINVFACHRDRLDALEALFQTR